MLERGHLAVRSQDLLTATDVPKEAFHHHFASTEDFALHVVGAYQATVHVLLHATLTNRQRAPLARVTGSHAVPTRWCYGQGGDTRCAALDRPRGPQQDAEAYRALLCSPGDGGSAPTGPVHLGAPSGHAYVAIKWPVAALWLAQADALVVVNEQAEQRMVVVVLPPPSDVITPPTTASSGSSERGASRPTSGCSAKSAEAT